MKKGSKNIILIIIGISILISYYYLNNIYRKVTYYKNYGELSSKDFNKKKLQLEHNIDNLKKNINNYEKIKQYLMDNDIDSISSYGIADYNFEISQKGQQNKLYCSKKSKEKLCIIDGGKEIFDYFNSLELESADKFYLRKDGNVGEKITYYYEKGYVVSFTNNALKIERQLYDSYIYYEKGRRVNYNEKSVQIDGNGNKIIKLPNEIITIYDDNWIMSNYIDKHKFE